MRLFIAVRSRFAEDTLAVSFAQGVRQLVVLGAGLDTYAYRNPLNERLRIFELDHPATQEWKRQRLAEAAIPVPRNLTFVAINFEEETLSRGLALAGFDPGRPTFFTWLGVVPHFDGASGPVDPGIHRRPAGRRPRGIRLRQSPAPRLSRGRIRDRPKDACPARRGRG